jgi:hypothetical protein
MRCCSAHLSILCFQMIQAFLDHMISVKILDHLNDSILERVDNDLNLEFRDHQYLMEIESDRKAYLFLVGQVFNHLLQCSGAMLIECDSNELRSCISNQDGTLLVVRVLEKFLTKIIAKRICDDQ